MRHSRTTTDFAAGLLSGYDSAGQKILSALLDQLGEKVRSAVAAALPALSNLQSILIASARTGLP
jgi:hypothetical protein